jgi:hypothetical protein
MSANPSLQEIKRNFEEFVRGGMLDEGFIVNHFYFSIPKKVENFFETVADDIYIMHISLDAYISKKEKAEFLIGYVKNRPIEKYADLLKYLEEIEEVKYRKFPRLFLHFNMHFLISQLSDTSKKLIKASRNLFTKYVEDSLYISLYLEIKSFSFDFDYYGKVL